MLAREDQLPAHCDYIAVCVPFGMMFGRLANFINGELWGRQTERAWAMVFPGGGPLPRHPSQLYEAALEGALMVIVMLLLFWKTRARWRPGLLVGVFTAGIALARFVVEFFREPDAQLTELRPPDRAQHGPVADDPADRGRRRCSPRAPDAAAARQRSGAARGGVIPGA